MSEELNEEQLENVSGGAGMDMGAGHEGDVKGGGHEGEEHGFDMTGEDPNLGHEDHPEQNPHEADHRRGER